MGKKSKTLLISAACLCIAGFVFFGAGWILGGVQYLKDTDISRMDAKALRSDRLFTQEKTEIDAVKGFDIELEYTDLYIKPSDNDKFYIEYTLNTSTNKDPIKRDIKDGMLTMTDEYKSEVIISLPDIGLLFGAEPVIYKNEVILYVPEGTEFAGSRLTLDDGDLIAEGVTMNGVEIVMEYGNLDMSKAAVNAGKISIDDGNCEFADVQMDGVQLFMEYGNLSYSEGDVSACAFDLDDGNVDFAYVRFDDDCSINDDYGNVTLKMTAENLINLDMDMAADFGEIYIPEGFAGNSSVNGDDTAFVRKLDSAKGMLKVYADNGNITIEEIEF